MVFDRNRAQASRSDIICTISNKVVNGSLVHISTASHLSAYTRSFDCVFAWSGGPPPAKESEDGRGDIDQRCSVTEASYGRLVYGVLPTLQRLHDCLRSAALTPVSPYSLYWLNLWLRVTHQHLSPMSAIKAVIVGPGLRFGPCFDVHTMCLC